MPQGPWLLAEGGHWGPILDMHSSSCPSLLALGSENLVSKPRSLVCPQQVPCHGPHLESFSLSTPCLSLRSALRKKSPARAMRSSEQ